MEVSHSEKEFVLSQGFNVVRIIGKGSYSKVFKCEAFKENAEIKVVACKIVNTSINKTEFVYKFFPRELEVLMKLKHPNIVHIYGIYKHSEKFYIFMRFAENKDLLEYIITKGEAPEFKARFWAWQIASALSYMHSQNIVHRDLKCENILLTINNNVILCDFGFSKIIPKGDESLSQTWCGSLAYTPPEILEMKPYNPKKVDPWSFGVVLYVILSKTLPFQEKSPREMLIKQKRKIAFMGKPWQSVTSGAKTILLNLLAVEPRLRWSPDRVLTSTWLREDKRLLELNVERISGSTNQSLLDSRRLSARLRDASVSQAVQIKNNRTLSIPRQSSFDYFKGSSFSPLDNNSKKYSVNSDQLTYQSDDSSSND